ncbi:hypothetical protein PIB30_090917 [Stylosanthes scabra]|uniref:Uncharacterized protein n=1 Tax=Stylosanthes scabra TaxID=79078 RepID=A0ABU6QTT2_9FABA|nr:hypothetical protein [Stylosanthes scabra]
MKEEGSDEATDKSLEGASFVVDEKPWRDILPQYPPLILKAAKTVKPSPNSALSLKTENHRNKQIMETNSIAHTSRESKTLKHTITHQKHEIIDIHTIFSLSPLPLFARPIAPFSPRPAASPSSSASSESVGSVHRERSRSPRTPLPPMAPAPVPGSVYPVPHTPMCDARRYRSLFPHRRVTPPTRPPPSPPPSDDEPFAETYDPAEELEGDLDEPYVAERVLHGAPGAYYSDTSYGSERESTSTDSAPSSHNSSGSSSGSVSLGYGSASSGSASDGASDDDLVNRYFTGTFPQP